MVDFNERVYTDNKNNFIFQYGEIINGLKIMEQIGKGSYGKICIVQNNKKKTRSVLKVLKNKPRYYNSGLKEIELLSKLDNSYNAKNMYKRELTCSYLSEFDYKGHKFIELKKYSGDLYHETKYNKLIDDAVITVVSDLVMGLDFLKKNQIIHADLKPENILFYNDTSFHVVICDFGLSMDISEVNKNYNVQSIWYRAPEIIFEMNYDYAIDIWSLGCIIFEIIYHKALFHADDNITAFKKMVGLLDEPLVEYQNTNNCIKDYFNLNNKSIYSLTPQETTTITNKKDFIDNYKNKIISNLILKTLTWDSRDRITIEDCLVNLIN
jgi:serine/threonine protein kinase